MYAIFFTDGCSPDHFQSAVNTELTLDNVSWFCEMAKTEFTNDPFPPLLVQESCVVGKRSGRK